MLKHFAQILFTLCLFNIISGSLSLASSFHERAHAPRANSIQTLSEDRTLGSVLSTSDKGHNDCDEEGCTSHQCHFGHCSVLVRSADLSLPFPGYSCLSDFNPVFLLSSDRDAPVKPPRI